MLDYKITETKASLANDGDLTYECMDTEQRDMAYNLKHYDERFSEELAVQALNRVGFDQEEGEHHDPVFQSGMNACLQINAIIAELYFSVMSDNDQTSLYSNLKPSIQMHWIKNLSHVPDEYVSWLEKYLERKANEAEEKRLRDERTSHDLVKLIWQQEDE